MAVTDFCIIRNQTIVKNGTTVYHSNAGHFDDFLLGAYQALKIEYPKFYKMDDQSKSGFLAAEVLLKDLSLPVNPSATAIVLANANASLDVDRRYAKSIPVAASPALFVYTLANIVAGEICIRHRIKGENAFFISPAFDANLMVSYAEMIPAPVVVVGWVDVLAGQHDVFLYLYQRNEHSGQPHTPETITKIYESVLWNS